MYIFIVLQLIDNVKIIIASTMLMASVMRENYGRIVGDSSM